MKKRMTAGLSLAYGAFGLALGLVATGSMNAAAQGSLGFASHNTRAPVSFDAGSIELQDRQNRVALSGGVVIEQAGLTVRSARMLLNYTDSGSVELQRITATGGVQIARGNERASGDTAIYDFNRRVITMAGNVRLRRGTDTLNGGRLVIDLQSGVSSVDGRASGGTSAQGSPGGRVTGTFTVPQGDDGGT
ncbi:MAG: LptA/OstA family protein [Erythrobacter sp.]|jgi:lipopolysaccharide export system protein LptA|nr:LptA/OstA family protein [Erythrobacter sp.]